ncbi:MAG: GTP-binding protein, partial [Bacteroidales bacterium]|nr:GTP-binding protein [Bacteroidales bacterium]
IACDYGDVDLDKIINTRMFNFDKVATSAAWISNMIDGAPHNDHDSHEHDGEHHHHHDHDHEGGEVEEYGIGTYVYYRRPAFNLAKFDDFVANRWPRGVIRAKGMCYFSDDPDKCLLFEQAGRQKTIKDAGLWCATAPEAELRDMMARDPQLRRDWDDTYGDRMEKIVFIGQHLDREAIARELDKCLEYTFEP